MTAQYDKQPQTILYMPLPDGRADVWLRRDIRQEDTDEGSKAWAAEERYIRTGLTRAEVEARFDALFDAPEEEPETPKTPEERIEALEQESVSTMLAITEIYEMMLG